MKNIYIASLFSLLTASVFSQQDRNISTWYQSPVLYNPAAVATGDEDFGFFTNFRSQWLTIPEPGIGLRTNTLTAEFKIPDGFSGNNNFGIGLNALNDQTGSAKLMTTNISIPINYTLSLDRNNKVSIGIAPGFYQQSLDRTAQTFENQWNGQQFISLPDIEIGLNDSYASIDLGAGVFYQYTMRNKTRFYGGLALNHLTRQKINFSFGGDRIYMQSVVQLGADITSRKKDLRLQPSLLYFKTGTGYNLIAGMTFEHILKESSQITTINKTTCVNYGFYYRHNDALITTLGFKIKGIRFGLAFDANLSYLSQATASVGALEVYFKTMSLYKKSSSRTKLK